MGADPATLAFYDREAEAYAGYAEDFVDNPWLTHFVAGLSPGAMVLDFGCGSAWAAHWLAQQGYAADAYDGSAGLAREAQRRYGVDVTVGKFEALDRPDRYDGIWASFCLLHDSRDAMRGHLARLHVALRPGGRLYLGLKAGTGDSRDRLGRHYTYYTQDEIEGLLANAGFTAIETAVETSKGFEGSPTDVLHILSRRPTDDD